MNATAPPRVLLASEQAVKDYGLTPLARFVSFAWPACARNDGHRPDRRDPESAEASRPDQDQLDWIELNEAFAAQSLAVIGDSELDPSRSIRWAARSRSGIRSARPARSRTATIVHGMRRRTKQKRLAW